MRVIRKYFFPKLPYSGLELDLALIVRRVFAVIPIISLLISLAIYFGMENDIKPYVVLGFIPAVIVLILLINKGYLQFASTVFIVLLILFLTWNCTYGNGIHDLAIVVYPLMFLFASLILKRRGLAFVMLMIIISVGFLTLGDHYNWYQPRPIQPSRAADAVVVGLLFLVGYVSISLITNRIKNSLGRVKKEVENQKELEEQINTNLSEKHQLFREVHHRVKNHLAFIHSVIDMEMMEAGEDEKKALKETQARAIAVARVHDQLYHSDGYQKVSSKAYLESVISNFMMTYGLSEINLDMRIEDQSMDVDSVIYMGVFIHEVVSIIHKNPAKPSKLSIVFCTEDGTKYLTLMSDEVIDLEGTNNNNLLDNLSAKLKGELSWVNSKQQTLVEISF